jgi:ribosomal-protein-serine acetyltransferase
MLRLDNHILHPCSFLSSAIGYIRPYLENDAAALLEAVLESVPELSLWTTWCSVAYSRHANIMQISYFSQSWSAGKLFQFACLRNDNYFVGSCGITLDSSKKRCGSLNYWIRSSLHGKGWGTQTAFAVARFGFEILGLERIHINVAEENQASRRVAENLGGIFIGWAGSQVPGASRRTAVYLLIRD